MHKLIVANYKMNGDKRFYSSIHKKLNNLKLKDTELVLCPPFLYLPILKIKHKKIKIGSQNISNCVNSKSTGQISPNMLKEFDVKYAIIGHSEVRKIGETEAIIAEKVKNACESNIIPIICVGEERKNSKIDCLQAQVKSALSLLGKQEIIFAYEPVWAIGSGEIPCVKRINKAVSIIKEEAQTCGALVRVLYGGSVSVDNYQSLLAANVDGFLLGGVSLRIDEFISIVKGIENE